MIAVEDPLLPGPSDLTTGTLQRITHAETVRLLRFRYRAGKRAILHLDTGVLQGLVWFFRGDKARRLARRNKAAVYDEATSSLYERFPNDHRMPQIRTFLTDYAALAPGLIGGHPLGRARLLRYRPGLSCTFRCGVAGGGTAFVKLINDDSPMRLAVMNQHMSSLLKQTPVSVAPVMGTEPGISAIAYAAARGRPLDTELVMASSLDPVLQGLDALRRFWSLDMTPERHVSRATLLARAGDSAALVGLTVPQAHAGVSRVLDRLECRAPALDSRPIHGDMKLEHMFLDGGRTTFIDTDVVSLGPPDYDLAQLYGRLWQAELDGQLPHNLVSGAAEEVRRSAGHAFGWCLDVVALRLAKFYAQRPSAEAVGKIAGLLKRLG